MFRKRGLLVLLSLLSAYYQSLSKRNLHNAVPFPGS